MFDFFKRLFGESHTSTAVAPPVPSKPKMNYAPVISAAQTKRTYDIDGHEAVLLGDIAAPGMVQYEYIMVIYDLEKQPCLFVGSEINEEQVTCGGGSHFLGIFPGDGHLNLGSSNEWGDMERFAEKAVELAREHMKDNGW
ncbi:MAG: hypothetical protein ACFCD0_19690 [Gemmataceae bacterium]